MTLHPGGNLPPVEINSRFRNGMRLEMLWYEGYVHRVLGILLQGLEGPSKNARFFRALHNQ